MLYSLGERRVSIDGSCFVASNASVIGTVVLKRHASVWFNAVIRGDTDLITVGEESNVQDGSVLHTDEGIELVLGHGCTVGHKVMLHGCTIGDHSLIGIGSTILNRARIGKHCIVGAHSLVTERKVFPDRSLILGAPAKVVRAVTDAEIEHLYEAAKHYVMNAKRYLEELQEDHR
jgi:carbonic anhydrase/acetyltransferase-like protein (isoleucine patch superfamily)